MNIQKSVHFCDHPMMCQNVYDTRAQVFSTIQTFVLLGQSRQGLDWIVRPGYSFGVFSKSRFAPPALSSVDDQKTLRASRGVQLTGGRGAVWE